jgi:hypothetical protein
VPDGETDKAFSQSIDPETTNTWQDTIDVRTVYRSPRLIAVKFAEWVCCGAYGSGGFYTVNIDAANGTIGFPTDGSISMRSPPPAGISSSKETRAANRFAASRAPQREPAPAVDLVLLASRGRAAILGPDGLRERPPHLPPGLSQLAKSTVAGFQLPP